MRDHCIRALTHRSQVRKILCDDVVGPYILRDTPHPPTHPYFFHLITSTKIKISKTLFLRFLKYKKLSAFCILICNWDERKTKATEESFIASVWASNMEENKSLKRISQRKKFRGVNRGLESVFELVYCLVLDWILGFEV